MGHIELGKMYFINYFAYLSKHNVIDSLKVIAHACHLTG